mmetsp:Transcript_15364/g.50460  ORF Transcript_15364/g.50460 Transcript_15364/m.50460 type:complete len:203 (-) Transcript_15364:1011-1619(-)
MGLGLVFGRSAGALGGARGERAAGARARAQESGDAERGHGAGRVGGARGFGGTLPRLLRRRGPGAPPPLCERDGRGAPARLCHDAHRPDAARNGGAPSHPWHLRPRVRRRRGWGAAHAAGARGRRDDNALFALRALVKPAGVPPAGYLQRQARRAVHRVRGCRAGASARAGGGRGGGCAQRAAARVFVRVPHLLRSKRHDHL